jgi:hypothetical protein
MVNPSFQRGGDLRSPRTPWNSNRDTDPPGPRHAEEQHGLDHRLTETGKYSPVQGAAQLDAGKALIQ